MGRRPPGDPKGPTQRREGPIPALGAPLRVRSGTRTAAPVRKTRWEEGRLGNAEAAGTHQRAHATPLSPSSGALGVASARGTSGAGNRRVSERARAKLAATKRRRALQACAGAGAGVRERNQRAPRGEATARTYQLRKAGQVDPLSNSGRDPSWCSHRVPVR